MPEIPFVVRTMADIRLPPPKRRWGGWKFRVCDLTLYYSPQGPNGYYIDLESCVNSAQILDWIFQIRGKRWATPKVMADLLDALHEILDPQANYCSWGVDTPTIGREMALQHAKRTRGKRHR